MTDPLISVVLPVYNGVPYLAAAIQSVLDQTEPRWELIIVDDASSDETPEVIRSFCHRDPRIQAVRNARNRKLPASLNIGFQAAQGRCFTWTSHDNLYRPRALERLSQALDGDPAVGVVYSDYTRMDACGREREPVLLPPAENILYGNCIGACFLYRREVHERLGGYDESLFLAEDYDFWLRAAGEFGIRRVPEDLYLYRRHPDSLTATRQRDIVRATLVTLLRNIRGRRLDRATRARVYARWAAYSAPHFRWRSLSLLATSLCCHPPECWKNRPWSVARRLLAGPRESGPSCGEPLDRRRAA